MYHTSGGSYSGMSIRSRTMEGRLATELYHRLCTGYSYTAIVSRFLYHRCVVNSYLVVPKQS